MDLWSHSVYTAAFRHCTWHHPACLSGWLLWPKEMPTMLAAPNACLMAFVIVVCVSRCGKLFATSVVLMRSSDGLPVPRSRVMLTRSFSWLNARPSWSM